MHQGNSMGAIIVTSKIGAGTARQLHFVKTPNLIFLPQSIQKITRLIIDLSTTAETINLLENRQKISMTLS